jgi:hypothetical protein
VPALLFAALTLASAATSHGQRNGVCDRASSAASDELEVRPADGAERVALNAPLLVRYAEGTDLDALQRSVERDADEACRGLLVCLFVERAGRNGARPSRVLVPGELAMLDDRSVRFTPAARLAAETRHFVLLARPGFDSAARTELEFVTGTAVDREPPELGASTDSFELDVEPPPAECDAPAGSLRVRLEVPSASDDGDEASVELQLFLNRASGLRDPELRARAPNVADGTVVLSFTLDPAEASAEVCVALEAVDGTGKRAADEPALCFNPSAAQRGQFVSLCSVRAPGAAAGAQDARDALATSTDNGRGLLIASAFLTAALGLRRTRGPRPRQQATRP